LNWTGGGGSIAFLLGKIESKYWRTIWWIRAQNRAEGMVFVRGKPSMEHRLAPRGRELFWKSGQENGW